MRISRNSQRGLLMAAAIAHGVLTTLAWRDIHRRAPAELRGSKTLWRMITALNSGNYLLYRLLGVR